MDGMLLKACAFGLSRKVITVPFISRGNELDEYFNCYSNVSDIPFVQGDCDDEGILFNLYARIFKIYLRGL